MDKEKEDNKPKTIKSEDEANKKEDAFIETIDLNQKLLDQLKSAETNKERKTHPLSEQEISSIKKRYSQVIAFSPEN